MRLRLLPVFALAAGLAMTAKLAGVWHSANGFAPALAVENAETPPITTEAGDESPAEMAEAAAAEDAPVPEGQITDLSSEIFDLTDEERERFAFYRERFDVPLEG